MLIDESLWTKLAYASLANNWEIEAIVTFVPDESEAAEVGVVLFRRPTMSEEIGQFGTACYASNGQNNSILFHHGHYDMNRGEAMLDLTRRIDNQR